MRRKMPAREVRGRGLVQHSDKNIESIFISSTTRLTMFHVVKNNISLYSKVHLGDGRKRMFSHVHVLVSDICFVFYNVKEILWKHLSVSITSQVGLDPSHPCSGVAYFVIRLQIKTLKNANQKNGRTMAITLSRLTNRWLCATSAK